MAISQTDMAMRTHCWGTGLEYRKQTPANFEAISFLRYAQCRLCRRRGKLFPRLAWNSSRGREDESVGETPGEVERSRYSTDGSLIDMDSYRGGKNEGAGQEPSSELLELAKVQLTMLVSMLESRIRDEFSAMDIGIRCAIYCRTASSLASRTLKLQLVASSDDSWDAPDRSMVFANEFTIGDEITADAEEAWVIKQPMIVLPDNGGLILPLVHKSFLVGLLLVERTLPTIARGMIPPPLNDVFGPAEIGIIKQSGIALAISCAMDLRSVMERSGSRVQQERMQMLISQATKPLSTLKTLSRMLQPRLSPGDPERDMTDSIVAQGQYLGDLVSQIQAVLAPSPVQIGGKGSPLALDRTDMRDVKNQNITSKGKDHVGKKRSTSSSMKRSYPALPSSSIGADNWDIPSLNDSDDVVTEENAEDEQISSNESINGIPNISNERKTSDMCDLSGIVKPLLDSASHFSKVKGIRLNVEDTLISRGSTRIRGDHSIIKHIIANLIDGTLFLVNTGDNVDISFKKVSWENEGGILMEIGVHDPIAFKTKISLNDSANILSKLGAEDGVMQEDVEYLGGWIHIKELSPESPDETVFCSLWLPIAPQ